jgi:hypothetical protein
MAIETLPPSAGGSFSNWTGAFSDIDEGTASPDTADIIAATAKNGTALLNIADSAVGDGDTVTGVDIVLHQQTRGAGNDSIEAALVIAGVEQGSNVSRTLPSSWETFTYNDAGWNSDWSAAQLDGLQVRLYARQSGMPSTVGHEVAALDVVITYTPAAGGGPLLARHPLRRQPLLRF